MDRPPRARQHCKHYSYDRTGWPKTGGPTCAVGVDLSHPGSSEMCMPHGGKPRGLCSQREDWTEKERADWEAWMANRMNMLAVALDAIAAVEPVPEGFQRTIECPHCDGRFTVKRVGKSAWSSCSNPECLGETHFNVGHGEPWPQRSAEA